MFRVNYPEQSNTADFRTTITVYETVDGVKAVMDLTDVDVRIELKGASSGCSGPVTASLGDGMVTVSAPTTGVIDIAIPASSMSGLSPGTYTFGVMLKDGAEYIQPMIGVVPVAQGLPKWV